MRMTRNETLYAIATMIAMVAILAGILTFWQEQYSNCWNQFQTEQQAIEECER
jgi:uncharacterized membrane protein YhfC